jgi:hypothetical protein
MSIRSCFSSNAQVILLLLPVAVSTWMWRLRKKNLLVVVGGSLCVRWDGWMEGENGRDGDGPHAPPPPPPTQHAHDGHGVVQLVHLIEVGHLRDVDAINHAKVFDGVRDFRESLVHEHADRVGVVAEPDEDDPVLLLGEMREGVSWSVSGKGTRRMERSGRVGRPARRKRAHEEKRRLSARRPGPPTTPPSSCLRSNAPPGWPGPRRSRCGGGAGGRTWRKFFFSPSLPPSADSL